MLKALFLCFLVSTMRLLADEVTKWNEIATQASHALEGPLTPQKPHFDWTGLELRVSNLLREERIGEAENVLEESIEAARLRGETSAGLAVALNDLGTLQQDAGRFVEAERVFTESVSLWRRIGNTDPVKMGIVLANLAGLRHMQGRLSDAEKLYGDAERALTSAPGSLSVSARLAQVQCGLAGLYWQMGRYEAARQTVEPAVAVLQTNGDDARLGVALVILEKIEWKQNRGSESEAQLRRAIEAFRRTLDPQPLNYASGLVYLAEVISRKDPGEASRLFQEALDLVEVRFGADHFLIGYTLMLYANHLEALGRKSEARELKRRGKAILSRHSHENLLSHTLDINAFQPNVR